MNLIHKSITVAALLVTMASTPAEAQTYKNPVFWLDTADPTVGRSSDGNFYAVGTGGWGRWSSDMVHWNDAYSMFNGGKAPSPLGFECFWAPNVTRVGNKYLMYYAYSEWCGDLWNKCGVGVMESGSPLGPYNDCGLVFLSRDVGVWNSIDPDLVKGDDGKLYLLWGSYGGGLWLIELNGDGKGLKPSAEKIQVAGDCFEGALLHKHNGYWYLFASTGTCCEGLNSTYTTVVGRSESLFGPYVDRAGGRMLDNKYHVVMSNNRYFKGTGHNAEILTDDAGNDWIYYHSYCDWVPNSGRLLMMDRVRWDNDWPVVNNGYPAYYQVPAPYVNDHAKDPMLTASKDCVHISTTYTDMAEEKIDFTMANVTGAVNLRLEGDDSYKFALSKQTLDGSGSVLVKYYPTEISQHKATLVAEAPGVRTLRIPINAHAKHPQTYNNPMFHLDSPDPSVERGEDGKFYAFITGGWGRWSEDMTTWHDHYGMLADMNGPKWGGYDGFWAPDVTKVGDKYVMYYAHCQWPGDAWTTCGIGVMTSDKIDGPYVDRGKLFMSNEIGVSISIDPHLFIEDDGRLFLSWGSYGGGLWAIELSADGLSIKPGAEKVKIAGEFEGCMIHKHDGYYYLFASVGDCCQGMNTVYTTVVGRSENYFGPYVDRAGGRMLDNKYHTLISNNCYFKGPGHNSEIITDDNGDDWIYYHSYYTGMPDAGRIFMGDRLRWVDGWPVVNNGYPSYYQVAKPLVTSNTTFKQEIVIPTPADDENAEWFDMMGHKVSGKNLNPGLYIKRTSHSIEKVIIK